MADNTNRREYDRAYKAKTYDQLLVRVKKGKREEYQYAAINFGMSLRELVQSGIEEYIANHGFSSAINSSQNSESTLSAEQKKLVDEFGKLPVEAQKYFIKAFQAVNNLQKRPSHAPVKHTSND